MDESSNQRLGELIIQLARGNASVLTEIAELIEPLLKSIANVYYKNKADVEDAVYNLYIHLYRKAKEFRKNSNAGAWVVRMFENSIKDRLREYRKEAELLVTNGKDLFAFTEADEQYADNHLFLRQVFDKLTEEERILIVYYYWCGCTLREVACIFHQSKSGIAKKLSKLEEKIKNL